MDNNDDDGENRDGDEQWYQYRTQPFCANVAYTLYGIPKHGISLLNHCSRGHYINSFFTYGGADVLLRAIGKSPKVYYGAEYNGYAHGYGNYSNADCTILEEGDNNRRELNSGENNNNNDDDGYNGISSTMGCSLDGRFNIATFGNEECDGNNFIEIVDNMRSYNRQMNNVGCHQIHGNGILHRNQPAVQLLSNSWACDIDLYGNGQCPDPYGYKQRMANSLRAVSHGQSGRLAIMNGRLKMPVRIISWFAFTIAMTLTIFTYRLNNKERIERKGKGKEVLGILRCLQTDFAVWIGIKRRKGSSSGRRSKGGGDEKVWDSNDNSRTLGRSRSRSRSGRRKSSHRDDHQDDHHHYGDEVGDYYDNMNVQDSLDDGDLEGGGDGGASPGRKSRRHKSHRKSRSSKEKTTKKSSKIRSSKSRRRDTSL